MQRRSTSTLPVSRELFIQGMRNVAGSVGVVTTEGEFGRHGATISAFSSVSADPPTLLICLRTESRIAAAVAASNLFCLNILSSGCAHVAERFSGNQDSVVSDRFDGIDYNTEYSGWVVLSNANAFCCKISEALVSGTHTVFFGNVCAVCPTFNDPLTYLQGRYRQLAQ
jgi:flavin reductase (DIM6/NTAB) family NADH-FMN oxidoreductase RutF